MFEIQVFHAYVYAKTISNLFSLPVLWVTSHRDFTFQLIYPNYDYITHATNVNPLFLFYNFQTDKHEAIFRLRQKDILSPNFHQIGHSNLEWFKKHPFNKITPSISRIFQTGIFFELCIFEIQNNKSVF